MGFWKAFKGHSRDFDSVIDRGHDLHGKGKGLGHSKDDDDCGRDDGSRGRGSDGSGGGWGRGSHGGSDKGSHGGSDRGSHGGSHKGSRGGSDKGSHGGSDKGSHGGSDRGSRGGSDKGSHGGSDRGSRGGSHKGSRGGSNKGSHGGSGSDCGDYLCGGNGDDCFSVAENTTAVTDLDSPFRGATGDEGVLYAIKGGPDAALFSINPETGELSFITAPDFEAPGDAGADNTYNLTVRTIDICNPCRYVDTKICVTVTDDPNTPEGGANAAPFLTNLPNTIDEEIEAPNDTLLGRIQDAVSVNANATEDTPLFTLTADDPNADDVDTLIFSIVGGEDAATFEIDSATGLITLAEGQQIEDAGSVDGDDFYEITVQVADSSGAVSDLGTIEFALTAGG